MRAIAARSLRRDKGREVKNALAAEEANVWMSLHQTGAGLTDGRAHCGHAGEEVEERAWRLPVDDARYAVGDPTLGSHVANVQRHRLASRAVLLALFVRGSEAALSTSVTLWRTETKVGEDVPDGLTVGALRMGYFTPWPEVNNAH